MTSELAEPALRSSLHHVGLKGLSGGWDRHGMPPENHYMPASPQRRRLRLVKSATSLVTLHNYGNPLPYQKNFIPNSMERGSVWTLVIFPKWHPKM